MPKRKANSLSLPGLPRLDRGSTNLPRLPKLPGLAGPRYGSIFTRGDPAVPTAAEADRSRPWMTPPLDWSGSPAEWAIYWAHRQANPPRGPEGDDWEYQVPLFGNFAVIGFVPDFSEYDVRVTIDINEEEVDIQIERYRALILSSFRPPFTHIVIDEEHALANPIFYLNEALAGVSHSTFGNLI